MSYEKNRLRNSDLKDNETRMRNINLSDNSRNWTCLPLFPLKWPSESRQLHEIPLHTHKDAVTKKKYNKCRDWCGDTGPSSVVKGDIK